MKTVKQVGELTGISIRTLQYYDEIGLFKPSKVTASGYRLYDDAALEQLQQILFFKELDFKLKEIKEILQKPDYDKIAAYKQQKKLLYLKRERTNRLIQLLEKLEKGEPVVSFKEFDLSEYIDALEQFKNEKTDEVIKYWGSVDAFNTFIQKIKKDESKAAKLAIKQFGSIENYTQAMKHNLAHFSEIMEGFKSLSENKDDLIEKNNALFKTLTSDMTRDIASNEVQSILHVIILQAQEQSLGMDMGSGYWDMIIESYMSSDVVRAITDAKYGEGASDYIGDAFKYYFTDKSKQ